MTPLVVDDDPSSSIAWRQSYLIDKLKQHLASVVEGPFNDRKYYCQAYNYLKVGAFKPVPYFVINLSDLTPRLKRELHELVDDTDRNYVLRQAVGRMFEDVNFELYHNSISRVLKVKLEK